MNVTVNQAPPGWKKWIIGARPRTLPAAIVPVLVGVGIAVGDQGVDNVVWWRVGAALAVSALLQIGVNYANDYSDGVRGTDDARVGPTRLVASGAAAPGEVKAAAWISFGLAGAVGLTLAAATSWWLLAVGGCAIAAAWGYTGGPKPYGYIGLGELFVFVFFGVVATVGTTYVAVVTVAPVAWVASVGVGCLACALLVVNNLRDIPSDRTANKMTLAVRFGDRAARRLYIALILGALLSAVVCALWHPWSLLAVAATISAVAPIKAVLSGAKGSDLIAVLGRTGQVQMIYGVLLAIGLMV